MSHSPAIATEAVQPLPKEEDDEISLLDLLQVVVDNLRLLVLVPLIAGLASIGVTLNIAPTFTATTKFIPPQQQQSSAAAALASLGSLGGLAGAAGVLKNPADQYAGLITSRSVQDALIKRFNLNERYNRRINQDSRRVLTDNVQIVAGKDGLITVTVDDKNSLFSAQLANAHVEELGKLLNRLAVTEAQQRRIFFEKLLLGAIDKLVKSEQALKTSGVSSSALKVNPAAAIDSLARLKATITAQEIKLASMRGYLTESAPGFKQAQTELNAMRSQMAQAEKEEPTSIGDSDYIAKYRAYKYNETLFELYTKQYDLARVDEGREGAIIQVVDVALPPQRQSKPNNLLVAIVTTLVTGCALLLFVFIRQALRGAAQTPESAEKLTRLSQAWRRALGRAPT